jgi:peptide-methionine (S)-S-oxide reductase
MSVNWLDLPETNRNNTMKYITFSLILLGLLAARTAAANPTEIATFAGGCFWCVESDFEHVDGVISAVSGYTGGELENPTYRNHGQHIEAVQITFDPAKISYKKLVEIFWRSIDPVDAGGQFCDRGHTYTTAIFANSPEQLKIAQSSKADIDASGILPKKIATDIREASHWTDAEGYHQDYHTKNPVRYKFYRYNCGRDARIQELWKDQAHMGIHKE